MSIFAPFEIFVFMVWTNYLEQSPHSIYKKLKDDFVIVLVNSYIYWIPSSFFCFYLIPMKYRAIYMCGISVIWDTFMSFAAHNPIVGNFNFSIIKSSDTNHN